MMNPLGTNNVLDDDAGMSAVARDYEFYPVIARDQTVAGFRAIIRPKPQLLVDLEVDLPLIDINDSTPHISAPLRSCIQAQATSTES